MCFNIVTPDMFMIFNFRLTISQNTFSNNMENAENKKISTTNHVFGNQKAKTSFFVLNVFRRLILPLQIIRNKNNRNKFILCNQNLEYKTKLN